MKEASSHNGRQMHPLIEASARHFRLLVIAVLLCALVIRIIALIDMKDSIYFDFLMLDENIYHVWAKKIADGTYNYSRGYEYAPLPAFVMAAVYKLLSPEPVYIRIMNILCGVLTCFLIYLIGSDLFNRRVGLASCLIAALYKPFVFYSIVPLKTSLSVFLFALTVYLVLVVLRIHRPGLTLLLGIVAVLLFYCRPNSGIMIPVILLILIIHARKERRSLQSAVAVVAAFVIGCGIVFTPFILWNHKATGNLEADPSQFGFNLYLGNNLANPDPYYRPAPFASSSPFLQGIQFTIEASRRAGKKLTSQEASSFWICEIAREGRERPLAMFKKIAVKTLAFFNRFEAGDHYNIDFMSTVVPFFKWPLFSFWFILPLAMGGIAVCLGKSEKTWSIASIFIAYGLTLVVFFTSTRYRLPVLVILIPFAVAGAVSFIRSLKNRDIRKTGLYAGVLVCFIIIEFLPIRGTGDMTAYYNLHAIILNSKGRNEEAVAYWKASSSINMPFSAYANVSLAQHYWQKDDIPAAIGYLERIPDESFAATMKYELRGDIMMQRRAIGEAISAYERSVSINSGQYRVHEKLLNIYRWLDRKKAIKQYDKLQYLKSFYNFTMM
ncbi:MAG: tetratricopeptide repeat protein [Deltaproteobacteria bacterium]|nr:tetratricopeptide repeat protein [Deltaproteobacteria bacterium]